MPDIGSAVAVLRWLVEQDHRQTPAYLVRTRMERALLALASDVSLAAYGVRITGIRRGLVERFVRERPVSATAANELLLAIVVTFEEFVGFTDVGRYSINARHPNVERSAGAVRSLCDQAVAFSAASRSSSTDSSLTGR